LGFPVISDLVHWRERKRLSLNTRLTLWLSFALLIGGAIGYFIAESAPGGAVSELTPGENVLYSVFTSASARTAGFALGDLDGLTPAAQFLTIGLMFIGTAPASMGGGITTGTLLVLLLSVWGYARGYSKPQIAGRTVAPELPRRAAAVLTVSIFVAFAATWLLLISGNGTLDEALFEVVSAFATTGWSLGITPKLNLLGQIIIMIMMIWGRLGALTIILAFARRQPPEPIQYPEESVLIG
jgi:trk system potassium uptake protein TrkH